MLREAVSQIPDGDYTAGLRAVVRHIDAAIKHFERAQSTQEEDAFTDSIYRTNQAYEGSLKEAYRVISGENPTKKTLFEIEGYLQGNHDLRARVLTQMARYREDYRNPSTHDYKLDFDENEALLAILSVAAFAKLLADQISTKVSFNQAKLDIEKSSTKIPVVKGDDADSFFENLSNSLLNFLNKSSLDGVTERENAALISAYLASANVPFESDVEVDTERYIIEWDVIVEYSKDVKIGFDIKSSRGRQSPEITEERASNLLDWLHDGKMRFGILVEGAARGQKYVRNEFMSAQGVKVHRLGRQALD
jgi:hypothetical protein